MAVKVLPRHFAADPTFTGRFEQEARVIAKLEHARILPVYDFGEQDDITYIVMRYLDAGTLAERIAAGTLNLREVGRIIGQIAEGLDYAHSKGVIHRDVKPTNIMLDESGDVYITDFGISKIIEGTAQFTGSGIVGTPAYVSPEQGLGNPIDHRSDIYALGVVLYEMVTGRLPYIAETPMAVVIKHINDPLPLPRTVNPDLPEPIERVILKALAKDPNDRYDTCGELAAALQEAIAEATDPHRVPTRAPDDTEPIGIPVGETVRSPLDAGINAGTVAVSPPEAVTPPEAVIPPEAITPPPPAKQRRSPVLPILLGVAGLAVVIVVALLALNALRGRREQAAEQPPVEQPPAEQGEQPGGEEPEPLPPAGTEELACAPDQAEVMTITFDPDNPGMPLPPFVNLVEMDDGRFVGEVTAEGPASIMLEDDLFDSTLSALVSVPPEKDLTQVMLVSRISAESDGYRVTFGPGPEVHLFRGQDPVEKAADFLLADGPPHLLRLHVEGERVEVWADDQILLEWFDPEPLPPGRLEVVVREGIALFDTIQVCMLPEAGPAAAPELDTEGEIVLLDEFNGDALDADLWAWRNEPVGDWELVDGRLIIPVLGETGFGAGEGALGEANMPLLITHLPPDEPYAAAQVIVEVTPTENNQGAGLVILDARQEPIFMLRRAFCDDRPYCKGDAVYFENLSLLAQSVDRYEPFVAAAGELAPNRSVALRIVFQDRRIAGLYRLEGQEEWQIVGRWDVLVENRFIFAGLTTSSGWQPTPAIPAFFDNFAILRAVE